jgi:hypothetical protein
MSGNVMPEVGSAAEVEKRELLARVLKSRCFRRAPKLREFLRFVCEKAIESDTAAIREQDVGCAVHQRPKDYSPSEDNIVRVEARNLRKKLDEYFETEGKDEPLTINIPTGTYVPLFVRRGASKRNQAGSGLPAHAARPAPLVPARISFRTGAIWFAALALVIFATLMALHGRASRRDASVERVVAPPVSLWPLLFDDRHNTLVVPSDSAFVLTQDFLKENLTLADYLKPRFGLAGRNGKRGLDPAVAATTERYYTSFASARLLGRIAQIPGVSKTRLDFRFPRHFNVRDFKGNHVVLLGSTRSNPWVELFAEKLNFQFEYDFDLEGAVVRNRSPQNGEQAIYREATKDGKSIEMFSVAALLPNLAPRRQRAYTLGSPHGGHRSSRRMAAEP